MSGVAGDKGYKLTGRQRLRVKPSLRELDAGGVKMIFLFQRLDPVDDKVRLSRFRPESCQSGVGQMRPKYTVAGDEFPSFLGQARNTKGTVMYVMGDKTAGPVSADLKNHALGFRPQSPKERNA